ncbi:hypothetical protein [Mycobacterium terramassiliense]|uniref:Mycobacterium terramassiliense ORFan n=1 Tax=Mycobacterium terramassiliense TaxID=1841859 RepID=A0A2U3N6Q0_9MYCO|nr:hypothetical protein [Mycobacterium terramassiliense]SPM27186.1 Mycobacterium terramassiliense ORFan [Mycobacterium terramassiliense]
MTTENEEAAQQANQAAPTITCSNHTLEAGYVADHKWQANFRRMAAHAAGDQGFYAIAGSTVRCVADEIQARWAA